MDNLLDTCIIISKFDEMDKFHKNSNKFIKDNKNFIISIYQEKKEIGYLLFRKEKIIIQAIRFCSTFNDKLDLQGLTQKDIMKLKKTIARIKLSELSKEDLFHFKKSLIIFKHKVNYFIKNEICRKIVPLDKIDLVLVEFMKDKISNSADSHILASAIQEHQENNLKIITNDINDIKKEYLVEALKNFSYKKIPEIKYLF